MVAPLIASPSVALLRVRASASYWTFMFMAWHSKLLPVRVTGIETVSPGWALTVGTSNTTSPSATAGMVTSENTISAARSAAKNLFMWFSFQHFISLKPCSARAGGSAIASWIERMACVLLHSAILYQASGVYANIFFKKLEVFFACDFNLFWCFSFFYSIYCFLFA